jgi:hypothetical protein
LGARPFNTDHVDIDLSSLSEAHLADAIDALAVDHTSVGGLIHKKNTIAHHLDGGVPSADGF